MEEKTKKKKKEEVELGRVGGGGDHRPSLFSHPPCLSLPYLCPSLGLFWIFFLSLFYFLVFHKKTGCPGIQKQALLVGVAPLGSVASLIIPQSGGLRQNRRTKRNKDETGGTAVPRNTPLPSKHPHARLHCSGPAFCALSLPVNEGWERGGASGYLSERLCYIPGKGRG